MNLRYESSTGNPLYDVSRLTFDIVRIHGRTAFPFGFERFWGANIKAVGELGRLANFLSYNSASQFEWGFGSQFKSNSSGIQLNQPRLKFQSQLNEVNSTFDCDKCNL